VDWRGGRPIEWKSEGGKPCEIIRRVGWGGMGWGLGVGGRGLGVGGWGWGWGLGVWGKGWGGVWVLGVGAWGLGVGDWGTPGLFIQILVYLIFVVIQQI
jgi:hypothetical protein